MNTGFLELIDDAEFRPYVEEIVRCLQDIRDEFVSVRDKHGLANSPMNTSATKGYVILGEEVGEVARAICDGDIGNYHDELIQVATMAIAMAVRGLRTSDV